MTNQEATDIRMSSPSTPLTTGEAFRTSCRMSSRASAAPACKMRGNIGWEPPCRVRAASLTRPASVLTFVLLRPSMYGSIPIVALGLLAGSCMGGCVGGCVQINGGAVEVSWVVHANGRAITDCSCAVAPTADVGAPPIAGVRIEIVGQHGAIDGARPCAGRAQCQFACQRQTGATPFDIPETHGG